MVFPDARSLPESIKAYQGFRSVLLEKSPRPVEFFEETVEVYRFSSRELKHNLSALLRDRYTMYPPEVVITGLRTQLEFLTMGEHAIFTNVPVITLALMDEAGAELPPNAIPVRWKPECDYTFTLIHHLQPDTTNLVIIGGTNPIDLKFLEPVQTAAARFGKQFNITWLTNHSLPEIIREVDDLSFPGSAIFYVSLTRDRTGVHRMPVEALSRIRGVSKVPIYGYHSTYLDYGLLGGYLWRVEDLGVKGGELAVRILNGELAELMQQDIVMPNRYWVNWTEMKRFGFVAGQLPAGTMIVGRPPSLWEQHNAWLLGGSGLLVALFSLGGVVVLRSRYQTRALREEHRQRDLLDQVRRQAESGELAAAIAHELNQPLASILSNTETLEMLLKKNNPPGEVASLVAEIKRDDERAGDIIRKIRALYASKNIELLPLDVNELVEETVNLFRGSRHGSAFRPVFNLELDARLPLVQGDRLQLQQVLYNLIANSLQMAEGKPQVEITTRHEEGRGVVVALRDHGPGVPERDVPRLFQPYFSTRPGGIGLGLAISRKIVEAHGGALTYTPHPGGGSVFSITFKG